MNRIICLCLLLALTSVTPSFGAGPGKLVGLADVSSGLSLREKPQRDGQKLATIPPGQEFIILDVNGPKETIEGKTNSWFKVTFLKKTGWVFGGFVRAQDKPTPETPIVENPQEVEKAALAKFAALARRDGNTLALKLKNGDEKLLTDNPEEEYEKFVRYHLLDFLENREFFLVFAGLFEGHSYLLISRETGQEVSMDAPPLFSPDGKRILSASCDLAAGYQDNGIEVFSCQGPFIEKVFLMLATQWGPIDAAWESDHVIRFTKAREGEPPVKARLTYDEEKDHWTVTEIP